MRKKKEYVVILALSIGRKSQKVIFLFLDRLGATKSVQKSMKNKTDFVLSDTVAPQILTLISPWFIFTQLPQGSVSTICDSIQMCQCKFINSQNSLQSIKMQNSTDINQVWQQTITYPICEVCIIFLKRKIILKEDYLQFPFE